MAVTAAATSAGASEARATSSGRVVASVDHATKAFGGVLAVSDVSFELRAGEVLALLGENGAGKSTCVKMLAGVHRPDTGHVVIDGTPVVLRSPLDALHSGIAVMHQHPGLFADLPVAENVFMGHAPRDRFGNLDRAQIHDRAADLLKIVGLRCAPDQVLGGLRSSEQQLVEIARALSVNARVLIMDEPTAALSRGEVERLFGVINDLRAQNVAMMFVGHRMEEIYRVADRITVLRDGRLIGTYPTREVPSERAVQLMVGRELANLYPKSHAEAGAGRIAVEGLTRTGVFEDVSFTLRAGEIVGFGGLVGSGRTEVARVLFGIDQPNAGTIRLDGKPVSFAGPTQAMAAGIAYVSEDRLGQSLIMDFAIRDNASLAVIDKAAPIGLISRAREMALVKPHLDRLTLKFNSYEQPVRTLSGGNQQKVVLSKWLATEPRVLILDEPTQGIDVRSKAEVHAMIADLAKQGIAILLISSEMPELLGMCDRIVVFREGRVTAELPRAEATQEAVLTAATDSAPPLTSVPQPDASEATARAAFPDAKPNAAGPARFLGRELGLVAAVIAVLIPVSIINPRVFSPSNITALSMDAALLMIVAAGQMLVLLTRNIDLSIASVIGLAAYISADALHLHPGIGVPGALGIACLVGLACGLLNGAIVTFGGVPAIVVTLGTLALYRGLCSVLTGGKQISADDVPPAWLDLTNAKLFGIPGIVIIAAIVMLVVGFVLRRRPAGRDLFAVGSNPDGARLIGIPARRRIMTAFAFSGLLAGFDGALWASRYATVDARVALGYELTVIAAVVVGGVAIRGGAGSVVGVVLGAVTLLIIKNGLILVRVDPLWLDGIYGLVIVAAITIDAVVARRTARQRQIRRAL
ncbi:ATP-binding cassette domain-containing protein [Lichenifustis flavocetrariae]|uniref:ATP-binding cassette domain-containing protein n=1 Tax=Lichenifustis flavocetrariae TaxID=2949735 RepID=A0AA42CPZ1_9HYPH|nr:ATP-binding cassette domain-containing protein [Lichenifustis flavocetrariae]MCW6510925.1 ATP-binding cassette domain-containing protein [Lichenifustis flavocetrariae]